VLFLYYSAISIVLVLALLSVISSVVSFIENEKRAAGIFVVIACSFILIFFLIFFFEESTNSIFLNIINGIAILAGLIFLLPVNKIKKTISITPNHGYDERDIIFSRNELREGTDRYNSYYNLRPENKTIDDLNRSRAGLLNENSLKFHLSTFHLADASFFTIDKIKKAVDGDVAKVKRKIEPDSITRFVKDLAKKYGASDTGVTLLKDYHKYAIIGRGDDYGQPVELNHKYAIAFAVEMDHEMIQSAPNGPVVTESSHIYLKSGLIAVQVAQFLRSLGHNARAHIDGNYRVVCPLVARDAGLGEIGRMGLLMTPKLGPRVRISVVTTDIEMIEDNRSEDKTVTEFCELCEKCSHNCPTQAIQYGDRKLVDGLNKWQIDHTACFSFWTVNGTDCGRCISVCPYSHPNNLLHNFIRWGIRNNQYFRRVALILDDLFYGKKPAIKPIPKWLNLNEIN